MHIHTIILLYIFFTNKAPEPLTLNPLSYLLLLLLLLSLLKIITIKVVKDSLRAFIIIHGSPWTPEVRTYGPDVDLALVEIEDSVAEDFWAGGLRRDGRLWGLGL